MVCMSVAGSLAADAQVHRFGRFEQTLTASNEYANPLKDVAVNVEFSGPGNIKDEVRAFWDGGKSWKVRYTPQETGTYTWKARSSDASDKALNAQTGKFTVDRYSGSMALYQGGEPRLSFDRHYLVQQGGKPWFFLSDTAWNGALLSTDDEWKRYLADRAAKGFTAVQFVMTQWRAGLKDENGQVAYTGTNPIKINPSFFQRMDKKVKAVNDAGLVAVPVMLWAYSSPAKESPGDSLPVEEAKVLAHYMAARYAGDKIIWMLGGDGDYTAPNDARWRSIGEAVFPQGRKRHLVGLHPRGMQSPWANFAREGWLDIYFYQSGHGDAPAKWQWNATKGPAADWRTEPSHPVIDAEINYEGHQSYQSKQVIGDAQVRRAAYYSLLAGPPAGLSYGAHGIWSWARQPEEPLNHKGTGPAKPWQECLNYPGAQQMKVLRNVVNSIEWWRLRPERYLLRDDNYNTQTFEDYMMSALTEKGDLGMIYMPKNPQVHLNLSRFEGNSDTVAGTWVDPRTGKRSEAGRWKKNEQPIVKTPGAGDWVLILQLQK
jgi:hypothetical protein